MPLQCVPRLPWAALPFLLLTTGIACASAAPVVAPVPAPLPPAPVTIVIAPVRVTPVRVLVEGSLASVGMDSMLSGLLDSILQVALVEGASPGAALAVGRFGRLVYQRGFGTLDYAAGSPGVSSATLYDLASLTKVIATTTVAMILEEEGRLDVARTVRSYLPEFDALDKAAITVRMLLTHSGGLESYAPLYLKYKGRADFISQINARPLRSVPGTATVYSDWDMVLLQAVIERITSMPIDQFMTREVVTCTMTDSADDLMQMMTRGRFRHVPVVENGLPVGIISARDALGPELEAFVYELLRQEQVENILA